VGCDVLGEPVGMLVPTGAVAPERPDPPTLPGRNRS